MPRAHSNDLRERVVWAHLAGELMIAPNLRQTRNLTPRIKGFRRVSTLIGVEPARRITVSQCRRPLSPELSIPTRQQHRRGCSSKRPTAWGLSTA